jgi:uncharacterized membrane protein
MRRLLLLYDVIMNILYCGDQDKAPLYISGALEYGGHKVTHVEPNQPLPALDQFDTYILSDYPAAGLDEATTAALTDQVANGKRFMMFGGWESFNGFGRNYYSHPIGRLLIPVTMRPDDDRVNAPQGLVVRQEAIGNASVQPDWDKPPIICGYNDATAKPGTNVLVNMLEIVADRTSVQIGRQRPLVIKGSYEQGTTIACMTDLAPHWSGGLTDWGEAVQLSNGVQVGDSYLRFVQFLLEA